MDNADQFKMWPGLQFNLWPEAIGWSFFRATGQFLESLWAGAAKYAGKQFWCRLRSVTPEQDSLMWHVSDCTVDPCLFWAILCSSHSMWLASHTAHATQACSGPLFFPGRYRPPMGFVFRTSIYLRKPGILPHMDIQEGQFPNSIFPHKSQWISLFTPPMLLKTQNRKGECRLRD